MNRKGDWRMRIVKIVSGGQSGADRAALDAAIACGVPHGGWCPRGRRAEDGVIAPKYNLKETDTFSYAVRTRANVEDSDVTLIFSHGPLTGGSLLTQQVANELGRPCVHIDLNRDLRSLEDSTALHAMLEKAAECRSVRLNVAGPRASGDASIYEAVHAVVCDLLTRFGG